MIENGESSGKEPQPGPPSTDPSGSPPEPTSQSRRIIVSVDVQHQQNITEVRDSLVSRGVVIEQVLTELGMITAMVSDEAHVAAAQQVEGVESVEQDRTYQLPPPDSPVQ